MAPKIKVGDTLPDGKLAYFDKDGKKQEISVHQWAANKKVILIGIPGAFTPVCSTQHLPGFIKKHDELRKFVDAIGCISVNDPFVMREWEKGFPGVEGRVQLFADGACEYTRALGFEVDLSDIGLGWRSRRFSLYADNLKVKILHLEEGGDFTDSGADKVLQELAAGV